MWLLEACTLEKYSINTHCPEPRNINIIIFTLDLKKK